MSDTFESIAADAAARTRAVLDAGGDEQRSLESLLQQIESQPGIAAKAKKAAAAALISQKKTLRALQLRDCGEALRLAFRDLGLQITVSVRKRKRSAKASPATDQGEGHEREAAIQNEGLGSRP
jgi:hypothetical protein